MKLYRVEMTTVAYVVADNDLEAETRAAGESATVGVELPEWSMAATVAQGERQVLADDWEPGDTPFGEEGVRSISDYLKDRGGE